MTNKTILFLAITTVLITGTLSVDQFAFAEDDDKKKTTKKVLVKTRDTNGDAVKDTTCQVKWRSGDSGPVKTNDGGVAQIQVPSEVRIVKATCGDGDARSDATSRLKAIGTTSINVIFEAVEEPEEPEDNVIISLLQEILAAINNLTETVENKEVGGTNGDVFVTNDDTNAIPVSVVNFPDEESEPILLTVNSICPAENVQHWMTLRVDLTDRIIHPTNPVLESIIELTMETDPDEPKNIRNLVQERLTELGYTQSDGSPLDSNVINSQSTQNVISYSTICAEQ